MKIKWDENKRHENIKKHGLDFMDVYEIFKSPMLIDLDDRYDYGEEHLKGIGLIKGRVAVIIFTETEANNTKIIRIISFRKALKYERQEYEKEILNRLE